MVSLPRKSLFLAARFFLPVGTVLALVAGFFFYYTAVISRQENFLDDHGLRSLGAVSSQFSDLINTYAGVFKTATPSSAKLPLEQATFDPPAFLKTQVPALEDVKAEARCAGELRAITVLGGSGYKLELASQGWCAEMSFEKSLAPLLGEANQIFDEIFLTDGIGSVLYQTQRAGVVADNLASVSWRPENRAEPQPKSSDKLDSEQQGNARPGATPADAKASPFSDLSGASTVLRVTLAGTDYRAYVVPIRVTMPASSLAGSTQLPDRPRFVLCGLVQQSSFRAQSRSLPLTVLTAIVLSVLLVIVGAWPLLKFATMRCTEEVSPRAGLYYSLSVTGTVILLVLLLLHVQYVFYDPQRSANLDDLAAAVDERVGQELHQVLTVMESVAEGPDVQRLKFVEPPDLQCGEKDIESPEFKTDLLSRVGMQVAAYPYFRRLFLFDHQGFAQMRWAVDSRLPQPLRSCDRPYFTGVLRKDLWFLREDGLSGHRFRIDPLYSRVTGEYLAVVAEPFPTSKVPNKTTQKGVIAIVTPLLSLIHPVLPPDYGFAVIDESGKVLFHSDATKNGRENFLDESGESGELRTAIIARQKSLLMMTYLGSRHLVLVKPFSSIQQCPWTLIVFSDLTVLADRQLERILVTALLACIYFALLAITVSLLRWWIPCYQMVWPAEEKRSAYRHLIVALVIVICFSFLMVFECSPKQLLSFAVFVPLSAIMFVILKLNGLAIQIKRTALVLGAVALVLWLMDFVSGVSWWNSAYAWASLICVAYVILGLVPETNEREATKNWSLCSLFSLTGFCLLILVAVIPCLAFFKISYDYDEYLSTRREQLLTMAALEKREQRVISQYLGVKISKGNEPFANDLGKWLFLRRRLENQVDLYDTVFRDQRPGQIYSPERVRGADDCQASASKNGDRVSRLDRWPSWFIWIAANLIPHRTGSLAHELEETDQTSNWTWSAEGVNRLRIHSTYDPECTAGLTGSPETTALAKLALDDPTFLTQNLTYDLNVLHISDIPWFAIPSFTIFLFGIFWSVRSTMSRMFVMNLNLRDAWPCATLDEALKREGNSILVGLPCSGKTKLLKDQAAAGKFALIDMAAGIRGEEVTWNPGATVLVLDHFEFGQDNDTANRQKLDLIEKLALQQGRKVVVVTTVQPQFHLTNRIDASPERSTENHEGSGVERWARLLARFDIFTLQGCAPSASGTYYRFLWSSCTLDEKVALHPLSQNGWANHKNCDALEHTWRRGLIVCDPALHLVDEKFAEFISGNVSSEERRSWHRRDTSGAWDTLRTMLIVLFFAAVAAVLFFHQNELLGSIAGATGVLTAARKVIADLRGGSSLASSRQGTEGA